MEVISESLSTENKDLLPQILMRIFSVCKADPTFPLKHKIDSVEGEIVSLGEKMKNQHQLIEKTVRVRDDLSRRLQQARQDNFEMKSRLLEELGSDV